MKTRIELNSNEKTLLGLITPGTEFPSIPGDMENHITALVKLRLVKWVQFGKNEKRFKLTRKGNKARKGLTSQSTKSTKSKNKVIIDDNMNPGNPGVIRQLNS